MDFYTLAIIVASSFLTTIFHYWLFAGYLADTRRLVFCREELADLMAGKVEEEIIVNVREEVQRLIDNNR